MLVCVLLLLAMADEHAANPVLEGLLKDGVKLSNGTTHKLPPFVVADGLTGDAQKQAISKLAKRYDWPTFVRKAVVTPHVFELEAVVVDPNTKLAVIDIGFLAYGKFDAVANDQALQKFLGTSNSDKSVPIEPAALAKLKIEPLPEGKAIEKYVTIESQLVEKVMLSGVVRSVRTKSNESIVLAWYMDPRFIGDATHPSVWQPLATNGTPGAGKPYASFAAYTKITALKVEGLEDAMFVEMHWVMEEPAEWFGGKNLLRSKLPIAIQNNVRGFRQTLTKGN